MRVPVVSVDGKPLMPTKPAKARKMMRDGVAVGKFNKLDIVQMMIPVGDRTQDVSLSVDPGSKYDGYAVRTGSAVGTDRERYLQGNGEYAFKGCR